MPPRTATTSQDKPTPRGARFEARLSPVQKGLLQRAADLSGRTLSEFVLKSAEDAAERLVREHAVILGQQLRHVGNEIARDRIDDLVLFLDAQCQ